MSAIDEAQLKPLIYQILIAADRDKIGPKRVRKALKAQLPELDIVTNAVALDGLIRLVFDSLPAVGPSPSTSEDVKPVLPKAEKRAREGSPVAAEAKKAKVKPMTDEEFARALQAEFERGQRSTRAADKPKKAKPTKKKRSKATIGSDEDDSTAGAGGSGVKRPFSVSGFNKPHRLSEQLAAVVGTDRLSRPTITKKLWVYIKEHALQKESDKRVIIPDARLASVFGPQEFTSFQMATLIGPHLFPLSADEIEIYRQEMVALEDEAKLKLDSP